MRYVLRYSPLHVLCVVLVLLAGIPRVAQAMHLCPGDRVPELFRMGYPWPAIQQHCSDGTPLQPLQSQPPPQGTQHPAQGQWQPPPSSSQGQWQQQPPPLPSQGQWQQQPPPLPSARQPVPPAGGSGITLTRPDGRQVTIQARPCTQAMVVELQQLGMPQQDIQEIIGGMCGGRLQG